MKTKNIILVLFLMTAILTANAQFVIDGSFRARFQGFHGYKAPVNNETEATFGVDQQSRLNFNYTNEKYSAKLTLQDARVWGSDDMWGATGNQRNSYGLGVYEAWVELKTGAKSAVKVGRQEWNYNGGRFLSSRGWWTTGLSYDAFLYKYANKDGGLFVDFGLSYNNEMAPTTSDYVNAYPGRVKSINFLNVKKTIGTKLDVSLNLILSGQQDNTNANTLYGKGTEGIFVCYNMGKEPTDGVFGTLSAYNQHGTQATTTTGWQKVSAYMLDAQIGFRAMETKLEIAAGIEMLSGKDLVKAEETDDNGKWVDSTYKFTTQTIDLLEGARHPYYGGVIDYITAAGTYSAGLMDPYVRVKYKMSKKNWVGLDVFLPMLANDVYSNRYTDDDPTKDRIIYEKSLGTNIDITFGHNISPEVKIVGGFTYAMISDSYKEMKDLRIYDATNKTWEDKSGQQYVGYLMLIVTPKFFSSEKEK